jgi:hypothetical protein
MTVIGRACVPKSITRTYCAKPDCDGEGFYSARCKSAGHATEDVEYVRAAQLAGAVEALAEWLDASDGLKAVDTSDGKAIRAALGRVDAAKATARALVGGR